MAIDWELLATALKFSTPKKMLVHLYVKEKKTTKEIGEYLGVSSAAVIQQLNVCRIHVRPKGKGMMARGGKLKDTGQIIGEFTCRWCGEIFWGDKRRKCCEREECKQKEEKFMRKRWREYRETSEQRKRGNIQKPCKVCGRDRGPNYYFCPSCLSLMSTGRMFLD